MADQIKKSAEKSAIPVQKDPSLAELLSHLHMNEPIPEHLYEAVAEVFAFIYQVEREMKEIQTNGNDRGIDKKGGTSVDEKKEFARRNTKRDADDSI
ncbi:flagellar biosynthesis [Geomicrobium sp. JCM 19037]|nr:flagellar biosynthesis [Geomicrobium sp. JCM 19037]